MPGRGVFLFGGVRGYWLEGPVGIGKDIRLKWGTWVVSRDNETNQRAGFIKKAEAICGRQRLFNAGQWSPERFDVRIQWG
jgi:hypothetical protein